MTVLIETAAYGRAVSTCAWACER